MIHWFSDEKNYTGFCISDETLLIFLMIYWHVLMILSRDYPLTYIWGLNKQLLKRGRFNPSKLIGKTDWVILHSERFGSHWSVLSLILNTSKNCWKNISDENLLDIWFSTCSTWMEKVFIMFTRFLLALFTWQEYKQRIQQSTLIIVLSENKINT